MDLSSILLLLGGIAVRHYLPALWPLLSKFFPALGQPAQAAPTAHPLLDAILSRVLSLVAQQKAGAALTGPESVELRTALPVAQGLLNEAAVGLAAIAPK